MNVFKKFMDTIKGDGQDTDDEYYDGDYDMDEEYEDEEKESKSGGFFGRKPEAEVEEEDDSAARPRSSVRRPSITPKKRLEVCMVKPTVYKDVEEITAFLLEGKAVVMNLEGVHTELAQRLIDFVSGATYGMDGHMQKISTYVFIATPPSVELSGQFQDLLNSFKNDASSLNTRI